MIAKDDCVLSDVHYAMEINWQKIDFYNHLSLREFKDLKILEILKNGLNTLVKEWLQCSNKEGKTKILCYVALGD